MAFCPLLAKYLLNSVRGGSTYIAWVKTSTCFSMGNALNLASRSCDGKRNNSWYSGGVLLPHCCRQPKPTSMTNVKQHVALRLVFVTRVVAILLSNCLRHVCCVLRCLSFKR